MPNRAVANGTDPATSWPYGDPPQPMGMNVPGCDNRKFAVNIAHWLSGLID